MSKLVLAGALAGLLGACGSSDAKSGPIADVYINEVQTSNQTTAFDENQEADDWVEIYNAGTGVADLEGYYVSDSDTNITKHKLPAGVLVEPGGFVIIWADGDAEQGPNHLPFKLSSSGEYFHIASPDGEVIDAASFGAVATQDSWARHPDGTGPFAWCATPTPAASNGDACAAAAQ